ncbi:MAG: ArsR/SmtB family transcription factor [Desulfobacteraceae bacterium]
MKGPFVSFPITESGRMENFLKVAKALSDANRVRILKMLQHKRMCVCEIQEALGIAQPTASKHLKVLTEAGLIAWEKDGLWVNYFLSDGRSSPFASVLLGNLRHWLDDDPSVKELTERLPFIRREDICRRS